MRFYQSEVKVYKRKKYKQYIINLKQNNPFNEGEGVLIYPESEINQYMVDVKSLKDTIKQREIIIDELKEELKQLEGFKEFKNRYEVLLNEHDKLRNTKDHLQERFNSSQNEVIRLERDLSNYKVVITKLQGLSFVDRLFNRFPKDIKALCEAPEK